jgi:CheY-like chemotaxis protein
MGMRAHGFDVWLAASAPEAVELFSRHRDAIDVVLLDVRMPELDGPETLAALREHDPHVICCFMSGDTGKYTKERLMELGAALVVQKPFRLNELADQLKQVVVPNDWRDDEWRDDFSIFWLDAFQEHRWEDDGGRAS